jgi:hypothetical protein
MDVRDGERAAPAVARAASYFRQSELFGAHCPMLSIIKLFYKSTPFRNTIHSFAY